MQFLRLHLILFFVCVFLLLPTPLGTAIRRQQLDFQMAQTDLQSGTKKLGQECSSDSMCDAVWVETGEDGVPGQARSFRNKAFKTQKLTCTMTDSGKKRCVIPKGESCWFRERGKTDNEVSIYDHTYYRDLFDRETGNRGNPCPENFQCGCPKGRCDCDVYGSCSQTWLRYCENYGMRCKGVTFGSNCGSVNLVNEMGKLVGTQELKCTSIFNGKVLSGWDNKGMKDSNLPNWTTFRSTGDQYYGICKIPEGGRCNKFKYTCAEGFECVLREGGKWWENDGRCQKIQY
uniref:Uncharacterized protein n=1 Tax=Chromera velia CCMP2878 TaxID=1169474 RepID=A0A0G4IEG3_9ALVE|eukprot:Cvel_13587.t1-p1 / transcript=Cvel_13587.t1 / gene=Cvel_13587 / organism=Chromera_velia_CCMP2878 / gene_product=hypothetical protein / transcript_product=hypothetical protein / location=Cvel_scaffold934:25507-26367(+) / protein_length=287 / sequence_SO=supercontig / SO=protein_coding / is_pseudo=false